MVTPRPVGRSLQEVRDALDQKVSVFEVGKQEVHLVLGADGHRTWKDAAAVCLLHDGHLESMVMGKIEFDFKIKTQPCD